MRGYAAAARVGARVGRSGPGNHGGVVDVDEDTFGRLVEAAIEGIPAQLRRQMRNVSIAVEDMGASPNLLGLYHGVPLTNRTTQYSGFLPDRITIYRLPIIRRCHTLDEVVRQVRITVVHEVAHHFGIDDDRLHELGWA
jgi:predicted Zn-dependent protease with MMP-like domain